MPQPCQVLLFGTMGSIGESVRNSLARKGLDVRLVDFPQNVFRDEPGYRRELMKALAQYRPDMILPIGHPLALARLKPLLAGQVRIPIASEDKIVRLDGKLSASRLAARLHIPQPEIYDGIGEIERYPVIFKRDISFGGSGVFRPRSREALEKLAAHQPGMPYLIEEYVEGDDYSVDVLRWGGQCWASGYKTLAHQGQGPSRLRESVQVPLLCQWAAMMVEAVDYEGVCGMDFRRDLQGNWYFLECNPRFTGGIDTQIEAGFDIPYGYWRLASGLGVEGLERFSVNRFRGSPKGCAALFPGYDDLANW